MALFPQDIAAEIDRRVTATVQAAGCPSSVTAAEVRDNALELLDEMEEEYRRAPEYAGQPFSNLWMFDQDRDNALFWVLIVFPDRIEFFCGTGTSFEIRYLEEPDDRATMYEAMRGVFHIPEPPLRIDRARAEEWLGRSW
jgi:hypothetical protein